jgi:hypothetical protein
MVKMVELLQQVDKSSSGVVGYMALKDVMAILTSEASESNLF